MDPKSSEPCSRYGKEEIDLFPDAGEITGKLFRYVPDTPDDDEFGKLVAQAVWDTVSQESYRVQRAFILHHVDFGSPDLFELLSQLSKEAGRENRQQCVELAQLALDSLEGSRELLGRRFKGLYHSALVQLMQAESHADHREN